MSWSDLGWSCGAFAITWLFLRGIIVGCNWLDDKELGRRNDD